MYRMISDLEKDLGGGVLSIGTEGMEYSFLS